MKIQNYLAGALLPALLFTSCLSDDDNGRNEETYTYGGEGCFNYVMDYDTEESGVFDGPNYTMTFNYVDATVAIDIAGLEVSNDFNKVSLRLPSLPYIIDPQAGFFVVNQNSVVPVNSFNNNYVFNNFTLRANPTRSIMANGQIGSFPIYLPKFELNGRYRVTTFPVQSVYLGTTVAKPLDTEEAETYTYQGNLYSVTISYKKMQASIGIVNSQFAESMPAVTCEIRELPITLNEDGYLIITEPGKTYPVYSASGKVQEGCSATNITASSTLSSGLTGINFDIDLSGFSTDSYKYGTYNVRNSLNYYGASSESSSK